MEGYPQRWPLALREGGVMKKKLFKQSDLSCAVAFGIGHATASPEWWHGIVGFVLYLVIAVVFNLVLPRVEL